MDKTTYIAGILDHQCADDPTYGSIEDAIAQAQSLSRTDSVCAVWEMPEGNIVALVYQQTVYRP